MSKSLRYLMLLLIFTPSAFGVFAQDISASVDSVFQSFKKMPPTEKLYLHMDRDNYFTGGTIWFKGYLVTATGNLPAAMSNFIYVELFDQADSLICRKKIKKIDGVFSGNIKLEQDLPKGSYFVRAYTTWMLNAGLDYAFYKTIYIGDVQTHRTSSKIEVKEIENGSKSISVYFADKKGAPISDTKVKCTLHLGDSKVEVLKRKTGEDGIINFEIGELGSNSTSQFIDVDFEDSPIEYNTRLFLDKKEGAPDVQFFPEGGDLIDGVLNRVAFKAVGTDGYSKKVWGTVLNSKNDTVSNLATQHQGMGLFYMIPETGEEYHAEINDEDGNTFKVELPRHFAKGAVLSLVDRGKSILVNVREQGLQTVGAYFLMAHASENVIFVQKLNDKLYKIPKDVFPEGIVNFVLLNENKQVVSSRMIFIRKEATANLSVSPDKDNYKRRDKVSLDLSLQQNDTTMYSGNFSIAVTDDLVVDIDSLSNNIRSALLLTSDLKGYIEDPGFYFLNSADSTNFYLDLLLLTQGWKRFDVNELLQRGVPRAKYYLELGQTISGKYEKMLLQREKKTEITALAVDPFITASTFTDENSNFIFDGLDFPDSTVFTIQSQRLTNIKQEPAGFIRIDKDTFPSFRHQGLIVEKKKGFTGKKLQNATERVYYDGAGKMIVLDEIRVDATDKTKHELENEYGISSTVYNEDRLTALFPVSYPMNIVIRSLPGVSRIENGSVYLSRGTGPAEILVDGMEQTLDEISDLYSDNLDHIAVVSGASAAFFSRRGGGGGVIIISLKEGGQFEYELKGVEKVMPLGYQNPVEFYVPKYEVDSVRILKQPDMRSTVYWNPDIRVQSNENTTISFYAADPSTTYTYIIEGTDNAGQVYRSVGKLRREDE